MISCTAPSRPTVTRTIPTSDELNGSKVKAGADKSAARKKEASETTPVALAAPASSPATMIKPAFFMAAGNPPAGRRAAAPFGLRSLTGGAGNPPTEPSFP